MSARRGLRVALIGATGAVGREILDVLEERRFPVHELVAFGSEACEGDIVEFRGEEVSLEVLRSGWFESCDLVINAAPAVLAEHLEELRASNARLVDVSGVLELDPSVALWLPGVGPGQPSGHRWIAVPRGVVAGLGLALASIAREVEIPRASIVCLEPAAGAGRRGVGELTEHTANVLNAMTGESDESEVFPRSLAFDCLPLVGELRPDGQSSEESRLAAVLRRLTGQPTMAVECTRLRVPVFAGSLAAVHLVVSHELSVDRARAIWEKVPSIRVLPEGDLPTPRGALGHDEVAIGRVRPGSDGAPGLAFVLALDDLRRGAAIGVVEAASALCP
jgi:aspartate-semialdehyde dehydrogenase